MAANFAYVNGAQYNYNSSSTSIPISALNVTSGNLLVVGLRWEGGGTSDSATVTLADTAGNTYSLLGYMTNSGEDHRLALFYCLSATGHASNAITGTISAARTYRQGFAAQYSYTGTIELGDTGSGQSTTNVTSVSSSPALDAAAGDLVVAYLSQYNSAPVYTPEAGYTKRSSLALSSLSDALPSGTFSDAPGGTFSSTGDTYNLLTAVFEAVGVLSSTIPLALTSSGAIAGTGAVSSTIPLALTPSGTLTGTGAVSAAVSLTLTPSGALAGLGALASDIPLVVSLGGTLENAGSDQLTGSVGVTLILSATLTGQGALSSAIPITLAPSATLTGTGALASAVPLTVSAASVLTGTGQLVTTMPLALTPSGTLGTVGSGALTSTVGLSLAITATLAGSGALTGTVPLTIAATGTMRNGAPYDLVGAIGLTLGTQGALTGRGALTSAVPLVVSLTADIAVQITGAHPDRIVDVTRDSRTVRVARTARGIDVTRDSRLIN